MSFLDRLFGRRPASKRPAPPSTGNSSPPLGKGGRAGLGKRPFEIVADAQQASKDGAVSRAESLFKQAIEAYRRQEPDGMAFALGAYGGFLRDQKRTDDAARMFEQAIERKTDIPASWSEYLRILADRRDVKSFEQTIERMARSVKYPVEADFVLAFARRADREGAADFAESVARWVVDRSVRNGDKEGKWAAIGDLGRFLERAGRLDEAVKLWGDAFKEGSRDPDTANRLSAQLERAKDYAPAVTVMQEALTRGLPANVEESLRKRLARCQNKAPEKGSDKSPGKKRTKSKAPSEVPAYSVRRESSLFESAFQIRLRPVVKDLEVVGEAARCLLASTESSTLVDINRATGSELRRVEDLPIMGDAWFAPDGRGLGIHRTAAIGQGPTLLRFLGVDGRVTAESSVPDATSEIALGPDLWYVGCRNGNLYGFGFDGKQRWVWETPGANMNDGNASFRPCPYHVASAPSFAAVSSMGDIYAVSSSGRTLWHAALPNERQTRWEFTVPAKGGQWTQDSYRVLGLSANAPIDAVKSAYRRLALETHPDRNPDDEDAAARFCVVQDAYERILARPSTTGEGLPGLSVSIEIQGMGPTVSFIAANDAGVVVGSSQGRLYTFDANGTLHEARVLGDGRVCVALRPNGTLGAAWCGGALLFFKENKIVNASEALDWPRALAMFGDDVVLWRRNEVQVMDPSGRLLWSVEFSKTVTGVVARGETLLCAAGVLAAFRRRGQA